ncbi:YHS domain-containing (seleno)protein [Flavobacterium sp. HJJ]|uniref:YHS domain-containing (seleno)protein n=1 Tax=Flavobacterium sp. HJJ TaxID=2783792 RepID=UPI00188D3058|nr:YHS domain-containing (seleno)protein [Flavobacterium sp. HJJ]MBF4470156.1 YHS domain protein [Flavobacterium sp. HJJ]
MKKILVLLLAVFAFSATFAQSAGKKVSEYNLENKAAIQGYDPVSYFKQNKAVKGKKEIAASYEGIVYQFSSVTNKEIFSKNPASFEPQYGGWCAYAMGSAGEKVEINPETFKIIDGKLYLFYNAFFNNTLKSWNKDENNLKAKADANWKKIIK